jgi:hypothetical protein
MRTTRMSAARAIRILRNIDGRIRVMEIRG